MNHQPKQNPTTQTESNQIIGGLVEIFLPINNGFRLSLCLLTLVLHPIKFWLDSAIEIHTKSAFYRKKLEVHLLLPVFVTLDLAKKQKIVHLILFLDKQYWSLQSLCNAGLWKTLLLIQTWKSVENHITKIIKQNPTFMARKPCCLPPSLQTRTAQTTDNAPQNWGRPPVGRVSY